MGLSCFCRASYELFVLRAIRPAIEHGQDLSSNFWLVNILVESCIPGLIIAFMSSSTIGLEFRVVTNPVFPFIFCSSFFPLCASALA
jgi:hypothetical protein